jgi:sensor c-di-GMP phosphodiesterase-like protein
MYRAKDQGRGRIAFYTRAMAMELTDRLKVETRLGDAIEAGEVVPWYQPIVRASDGACVGLEALARWVLPDGEVKVASAFVPQARAASLGVALDAAILDAVLLDIANLRAAGYGALRVHVNVTPAEILAPGFADRIAFSLRYEGVPPAALALEVAEDALTTEVQGVWAELEAL